MNKDQYTIFDYLNTSQEVVEKVQDTTITLEQSCLNMIEKFKTKGFEADVKLIDNQIVILKLLQPCSLLIRGPIEGEFIKEQPNLRHLRTTMEPDYTQSWMVKND